MPHPGNWAPESNHLQTGEGFAPRCRDEPGFTCTGMWGPYNLEIVDQVHRWKTSMKI